MLVVRCVFLLSVVTKIRCAITGHVVNGENAEIKEFPHSVYLGIICKETPESCWVCGGSILNQRIIVTAAHCLYPCKQNAWLEIHAGSSLNDFGFSTSGIAYLIHNKYDQKSSNYDLGLAMTRKNFPLGSTIARLAIMQYPPVVRNAKMAGWGVIDEEEKVSSKKLQKIDQIIWDMQACLKAQKQIPPGTFCAAHSDPSRFASSGDSGSALVANGYIGIGMVSFKRTKVNHVIVYTNLSYHLNWIKNNAEKLYCSTL